MHDTKPVCAIGRWAPWIVAGLLGSGCDAPVRPAESFDQPAPEPISLEHDVGEPTTRAPVRFARRGAAHVAEHPAFVAEIDDEGTLTLSPPAASALALQTTVIERGGGSLWDSSSGAQLRGQAVELARGQITEQFEARDRGIEQRWLFDEAPPGAGDLHLQVSYRGYVHEGENLEGHRLVDPITGTVLMYGTATWIDAAGARSRVEVTHDAGGLQLTVPEDVLERSQFPAVLDPVIGPAVVVDDARIPATGDQRGSRIASDGAGRQLIVWVDRSGGDADIRGAIIQSGIGVITPNGITIASGAGDQSQPSVAWDGTSFVVAWQDPASAGDIRAARVVPSGFTLDFGGVPIATGAGVQATPSLDCEPGRCLVAWFDSAGGGPQVRSRFFTPSTGATEPVFTVSGASTGHFSPEVAYRGGTYVVAWNDQSGLNREIRATRVTPTGTISDPGGVLLSQGNYNFEPEVVVGAGAVLVAWRQTTSVVAPAPSTAYARVMSLTTGAALGSGPLVLASSSGTTTEPGVAFDGSVFLATWGQGQLLGRRISTAGVLLDAGPIGLGTAATSPLFTTSAAFDGTGLVATWADNRDPSTANDIYAAVFDPSLNRADPDLLISSEPGDEQSDPAIVAGDDQYLLVWQDRREGSWDILGARVARSGLVIDDEPLVLSAAVADQIEPSVTFDGVNYFVAWADTRSGAFDLYGTRVSAAGEVLDPSGLAVSTVAGSQRQPKVAFNGSSYLVAYTDTRAGNVDIYATRVSLAGTVLDAAGIAVSTDPADQAAVDVAHGNAWSYVVWEQPFSATSGRLRGTAIAPSGFVLAPNGLSLGGSSNVQAEPAVESNGTDEFLVVWQEVSQIRGRTIEFDGDFITTVDIGTGTADEGDPDLAFDGDRYLVVWRDQTTGTDVNGALVDHSGTIFDPEFTIAGGSLVEDEPTAAGAAPGLQLVAYHVPSGNERIRVRTLGNGCCDPTGFNPGCLDAEVEACVCASDPFCCTTDWDGLCVSGVELGCGTCSCCEVGGPGCGAPDVQDCVCAYDSYCCDSAWDSLCVQEVVTLGCGTC